MKRLFFLAFAFAILCGFSPYNAIINCYNAASGGDACTGCSSATDTAIYDNGNTKNSEQSGSSPIALKISFASEVCVTGLYFYGDTQGSGTEQSKMEIWSHNAGSNAPDSLYGANYTKTENMDASGAPYTEAIFATPQTLPAGTYWAVWTPVGGGIDRGKDTTSPTGTYKYWTGAAWAATSYYFVLGVLGCE